MGWVAGAWASGAWRGTAWAVQDALVTVPDVVGETQAAGTATLEGDGFVVAVATAHSSVVPAGTIISQVPAGGSQANSGSTVTITVSLGEAAVQAGGGGFFLNFEVELERLRRKRRKREEEAEETEAIQDDVTREIAALLKSQEAKDDERETVERVRTLVRRFADRQAEEAFSERTRAAFARAAAQENAAAIFALIREMERQFEEEELAVLMALAFGD